MLNLKGLTTETRNENTKNIDKMSTIDMVRLINQEDQKVAIAVEKESENIAKAIDVIYEALLNGGRLIYMGAGTSGRLGILDASECPPTYGVSDELVQGLIAGGSEAILKAKEGAEDSKEFGKEDLVNIELTSKDVVCGIAASGRTPYVIGGAEYAKEIGARTISVACNGDSELSKVVEIPIAPVVGPEVVTGSTRMKSGTAQKLVLNMLSTGTMIKLGKVYGNLMVDVKSTNEKLVERAKNIVVEATGVDKEEATNLLKATDFNVKLAIFMKLSGLSKEESQNVLDEKKGHISNSLQTINL